MATVVSIWLVGVLTVSALMKLGSFDEGATALSTYAITARAAQRAAFAAVSAAELLLAGGLTLGFGWAPGALAGLLVVFTLAGVGALLAGRRGRPCACFGSSSRLSRLTPVRAGGLALIAGALAAGWIPTAPGGYDRWLTVGFSLCIAAVAALAVAGLALAREVGVLRLGMGGRGALEIPQEGPAVGSVQPWAKAIPAGPRALLRVAVFSSEGCPMCRQLEPAVGHIASDPLLAVGIFDEAADASTWREAAVPGSPYAIALSLEGTVMAKGTFNSLGQLESVLATARSRESGLTLAA